MKSVFRGLSAKLALALLAVGALTSCYEKEELDQKPETKDPDPVYIIQGNVSDAANGKYLNAEVTIDGESVNVVNGYYQKEVKEGQHVVVANKQDYFTATKTVYFHGVKTGVSYATVDFALVGLASSAVDPDDPSAVENPVSKDESETVLEVAKEDVKNIFSEAGIALDDADFQVTDDGIVVTKNIVIDTEIGGDVEIQLPIMTGFASTITPEQDNLFTKALTDGQVWVASAEKALNMKYGLKAAFKKHTLKGVVGKSIASYVIKAFYQTRMLSFYEVPGLVMWQSEVSAEPVYESHDNHDSHDTHDAHDGHGNSNPAAGGGSTSGE